MRKKEENKGITLIALVITIVVLLILAGVTIATITGENGVLTRAQEASFRTEMAGVREVVDLYKMSKKTDEIAGIEMTENIFGKIPIPETDKWKLTLKTEIIYWGDYELTVNEATDSYIDQNFANIIKDTDEKADKIYYIKSSSLKKKTYVYNEATDIVYKIPVTGIGRLKVHSIEELDYKKNGGSREKGKNYTKINQDVEFKQVGNVSCYEPDLNGFGKEVTSLIFYKKDASGQVTSEEHIVTVADWIEKGKPNEITEGGNSYILYDYEKKAWANIRVISGSIETYWTWIPRYGFKNEGTKTDIKFVQTTESLPEGYELAGSFDGNDKKGIWISKYQPSYKVQADSTYFSYYIPDLEGFDKENTYVQVYNKDIGSFTKEVKASEINNLTTFSQNNLWFDYDNKIWANIRVEKNGIETWWVWIPRYAYSVGNTTSEVVYIDNINNKPLDGNPLPGSYAVAPAFEGNNKKGIWVSKYEPSPKTNSFTQNINVPDLNGFDPKNTYIQIYDKSKGKFVKEVQASKVSDLADFAKKNLWYDYENQIWANIRVEKNGVETWWVWIPRYAYSNGYPKGDNKGTTDIVLITPDNKMLNGQDIPKEYKISETFENNANAGMWVSKYQPSNK